MYFGYFMLGKNNISLTKDPHKCRDLRMCARKSNRKKQHWRSDIEASLFIKLKCEKTS